MRFRYLLASVSLAVMLLCSSCVFADLNPLITVDENGNGTLLFPGGSPIPTHGVLAPDPGPGGLAAALTYNLLGPPALVAGDVFLLEGTAVSEVIRFNPAGTGNPGYPASLLFYSVNDDVDHPPNIADTGLPTAFYTNQVVLPEVIIPGGEGGAIYTPNDSQPGFVPGFSVTYRLISDTPEPNTIVVATVAGVLGLVVYAARRRRHAL
jgi:hypothetical protein